jgi:uncharacterized membrane protein YphA (DoxX/SURF4 family)
MKIAATIARILLGLVFFASGISVFLPISMPPPPPGLAGEFTDFYFKSHYVLFVDGLQLLAGLMLLTNRFVPLALAVLSAIIANILIFHITVGLAGLPIALVVAALWGVVARQYWSHFAPFFARREERNAPAAVPASVMPR